MKSGDSRLTAALSRDHTIHIDASGLLTTTGGKWTTYRHMAEDTVNQAADLARLPERPCVTRNLNIHGFHQSRTGSAHLSVYGSDAPAIQALRAIDPALAAPLDAALPYTGAEVVWAARTEMARTVEDVLARRTRALFLNATRRRAHGAPRSRTSWRRNWAGRAWQAAQVEEFTRGSHSAGTCVSDSSLSGSGPDGRARPSGCAGVRPDAQLLDGAQAGPASSRPEHARYD